MGVPESVFFLRILIREGVIRDLILNIGSKYDVIQVLVRIFRLTQTGSLILLFRRILQTNALLGLEMKSMHCLNVPQNIPQSYMNNVC